MRSRVSAAIGAVRRARNSTEQNASELRRRRSGPDHPRPAVQHTPRHVPTLESAGTSLSKTQVSTGTEVSTRGPRARPQNGHVKTSGQAARRPQHTLVTRRNSRAWPPRRKMAAATRPAALHCVLRAVRGASRGRGTHRTIARRTHSGPGDTQYAHTSTHTVPARAVARGASQSARLSLVRSMLRTTLTHISHQTTDNSRRQRQTHDHTPYTLHIAVAHGRPPGARSAATRRRH